MLTTYRRALSLPGAWQFSATGFVARLPIAMVGLAIVLLISETTGSYALAGLLSAAYQVCAATGALLTSRQMDRLGQHRLLPPLVIGNTLLLFGFVAAVELDLPLALAFVLVAAAGACQPAMGSIVRARWAAIAPDADRLRSAFALESIIDEIIFTIGPLLTAFLAFQVSLPSALITAAIIGLGGGLLLAAQRRTQPAPTPATPRSAAGPRESAIRQPGLILLVLASLGIGLVFGSYEVAVVAFTQDAGAPSASGVILGLWAVSSMVAGIVFGARHWRVPLARQVGILTGVLALVLIPVPFISSVPALAIVTLISGGAVAPALIATFSLTERLVPDRLLTEGLTWTNSGLALGFAIGTTTAGAVVDAHGTDWAFVLPILGAVSACLVASTGRSVLARSAQAQEGTERTAPPIAWISDPLPGPTPGGITDDPDSLMQ